MTVSLSIVHPETIRPSVRPSTAALQPTPTVFGSPLPAVYTSATVVDHRFLRLRSISNGFLRPSVVASLARPEPSSPPGRTNDGETRLH